MEIFSDVAKNILGYFNSENKVELSQVEKDSIQEKEERYLQ